MTLTRQEKALYQQIHPVKLATDWGTTLLGSVLLWQHELLQGLAAVVLPAIVATAGPRGILGPGLPPATAALWQILNISRYIESVMQRQLFAPGPMPFLMRGDMRPFVLRILRDGPMHGYEIMKVLEERSHGMYRPSPGSVYPALRSLLARGLVDVSGAERRKTYRLTPAGRALIRKQRRDMQERFRTMEAHMGPERAALFRELRKTGRLIGSNMRDLSPAQARTLAGELARLRQRLTQILAE